MKLRPFAPLVLPVALLAAAVAFPLVFSNPAVTTIAVFTVMYAAASSAWNIFAGYTGYIALGHAAFFGTGAYALAILCQRWHVTSDYGPILLLPLCGLIVAAVAVPLGVVALRVRSHTFIVITIAIFFIGQLVAENNLFGLTHGTIGFELPIPSWTFDVYNLPFYYTGLVILLLALATSWWVRHSRYGLGLLAIRDDEDRARGLGVKTGRSKLLAFVVSAFFVGMIGGLTGYFIESIFPPFAFNALYDVAVALMAFLGGLGTLSGPILGALILVPAQQELTSNQTFSRYYLVLYGAVLLFVILLMPEGIIPTLRRRWVGLVARRAAPSAGAGAPPAGAPGSPTPVATAGAEGGEP
jgi:branched-chain amino acid transport system permease protein